MEKAREFAVVNLVRSGGEPRQYSSGRVDNDWSARHVRLRFEMIVSSVLFYLIGSYGAETVNLPIITLPKIFDERLLISLALGFSIFTILSFFVRSQYERSLWPKQELVAWSEINQLKNEYTSILSNLEKTLNNKHELNDFLSELLNMRQDLTAFDYSLTSLTSLALTIKDLHEEKGVNNPVHPKFWAKIVTLLGIANRHSSFLYERVSELECKEGRFISVAYSLKEIPSGYSQNREALVQTLNKITPEFLERIEALKKFSIIRKFQTTILSVWIPICFSGALVVFGIFNMLGKI